MARHEGGERYEIALQAAPDDVPPHVRLRTWLKSALRSARMRAVTVRQLVPPTAAQEAAGHETSAGLAPPPADSGARS